MLNKSIVMWDLLKLVSLYISINQLFYNFLLVVLEILIVDVEVEVMSSTPCKIVL